MTKWNETDEGTAFIASAASRETSKEIMEAIAFFARTAKEAEALWENGYGAAATSLDFWEHVTGNGLRDPSEFVWGASGSQWWENIKDLS